MLKKVSLCKECRVSLFERSKYSGSYGDAQLLKIVAVRLGLDKVKSQIDGYVFKVQTDYKSLETIYSVEDEFEIEDFERIDHSRYETYLNIVLDKYICVAPATLDVLDEVTFTFLGKQNLDYLHQKLAQCAAKQHGLDINKIWIDEEPI